MPTLIFMFQKLQVQLSYEMHAYNFNDPLYFGKEYDRTWSGAQSDGGGKNTAIEDMGSEWRIGLVGWLWSREKI